MSPDSGKIEAAILDALTNNRGERFSVSRLAAIAYDLKPDSNGQVRISDAQAVAVRRALSRLRRKGIALNLGRFDESQESRRAGKLPVSMWASEETARDYATELLNKYGPTYLSEDLLELATRSI